MARKAKTPKPGFTPGPWRIDNGGFRDSKFIKQAHDFSDSRGIIVIVSTERDRHEVGRGFRGGIERTTSWKEHIPTAEADAHLIAAAPELYGELARLDPSNPVLAKARGETKC